MRRRALLSGLAAGTTAALAGCTDRGSLFGDPVQETRERYFDLPDGGRLRIENANGDVNVSGRNRPEVSVDAVVTVPSDERLDDVTVAVSGDGDDRALTVDIDGDTSSVSVDIDVRAPEDAAMGSVQTDNGHVEVRGVAGVAAARSMNGSVTVRDAGPVSTVASENGDVAADVPAPLPGDVSVRTENGDVEVALSPEADATLDARTETGYVEIEELPLEDERGDNAHVTGTLGGGTRDVTIGTTNGRVVVEPLE
ncbi:MULTISPECIES: DUF4097 family beta strand repeat-containing protein [Halobacterium]|uniref:DUF4097 family beta strand repeat-containing protein n=1 Tax=Halobacterium TaxID=2239 RepID=UPI00073F1617|nr:DUF4097 family beta strand repeat-containing protein [Halobacterium sp. CBA1132]MCG1004257.1 DUF4097 domain-containing protein [Halobacterium noricense]